ncbi:MAG TPA: hypothetical protein VGD74_02065 [Vulgatibacter sp.]
MGKSRLGRPIVLFAILLGAWFYRGAGAREVALTWVLPSEPPIAQARISLLDPDGAVATSLTWGSAADPAATRIQRANLAPGAYRIQALLLRSDGSTSEVQRELVIDRDDDAISIHLAAGGRSD